MYQIQTGNIAQIVVEYATANTVTSLNVLHYRYVSAPTLTNGPTALLELVDAFLTVHMGSGWLGVWQPLAATTVNLDKVTGQMVYPIRYAKVESDIVATGSVAAQPLPSVVQWSITKKAELAAPYGVGGIRMTGLPDTMEVNGELTAPALVLAADVAAFLKTNIAVNGVQDWEPIIYRRTVPSASLRVDQAVVQNEVRSQRSRIAFRGI